MKKNYVLPELNVNAFSIECDIASMSIDPDKAPNTWVPETPEELD